MFSAVGAVTQISAGSADVGTDGNQAVRINTSAALKEVKSNLRVEESSSIKFDNDDELSKIEVDPSSSS